MAGPAEAHCRGVMRLSWKISAAVVALPAATSRAAEHRDTANEEDEEEKADEEDEEEESSEKVQLPFPNGTGFSGERLSLHMSPRLSCARAWLRMRLHDSSSECLHTNACEVCVCG